MMNQYANAGIIPGRVKLMALKFTEWDLNFFVPPRVIIHRLRELLPLAQTDLVSLLHKRLHHIPEVLSVPIDQVSG